MRVGPFEPPDREPLATAGVYQPAPGHLRLRSRLGRVCRPVTNPTRIRIEGAAYAGIVGTAIGRDRWRRTDRLLGGRVARIGRLERGELVAGRLLGGRRHRGR